jgi:hypothetical protein
MMERKEVGTKKPSMAKRRERGFVHDTSAIFLFNMCYLFGPLLAVALPVYLILCTSLWWVGLGAVTLYLFLSYLDGTERRLGRPWPAIVDNAFFDYLFSYFPMELYLSSQLQGDGDDVRGGVGKEASTKGIDTGDARSDAGGQGFDSSRRYVFAVHPHGTLALNRGIFAFNRSKRWNKVLPGIETRDLVASAAFKIPVIRDIW